MYQTIVLGLGFLLIIGGGYLIKSIDKEGVILKSLSKDQKVEIFSLTADDISGTFLCNETSGCENEYAVTFSPSGDVQLMAVYKDGIETLIEKGIWRFETGGLISISLTDSQTKHYDIPHSFLIQSVSTSTLAKISYDVTTYPDMHKPVFIRQGE